MGIKGIIAGVVAACGIMAVHSPAWALAVNTTPVAPVEYRMLDGSPMTAEQVAVAKDLGISPEQMAAVQEMVAQANAGNKPMIKVESWTWVLSIVPGLGQFLMGDMTRGIIIFLIAAIVPPVLGMVIGALGFITGGLAWVVAPIIGIAALVFWLWNLWDAYSMNQRMLGKSAEIQITPELRAKRKDGDVALNYTFGRF
jgi:hypothetical protein